MARHRLAGEERARTIIEAAVGLFARRGFAGVTSREIARAARVSEGLVFKHFPRKHSLYRAILEAKMRELRQSDPLERILDSPDDEAFLAAIATSILTRIDGDDTFFRLLVHSALEGHPLAREFHRLRVDRVREGIERRIRRRFARRRWKAPLEPGLAARIFNGMIMASVMNRRLFKDPVVARQPAARLGRRLAQVFLHGLEPHGGKG